MGRMVDSPSYFPRRTILVCAPGGRDAEVICGVVERVGLACEVCLSIGDLVARLETSATAVVADEALDPAAAEALAAWVRGQPSWSDFPFVLLSRRGESAPEETEHRAELLGNVTLLERPCDAVTLVSAVSAARRARERQLQLATELAERQRIQQALDEADRRFRDELEDLVRVRTKALEQEVAERQQAQKALLEAQKMEALGRLTAGVAHDFNNLLTIMRASADFLCQPELSEDRRRRYVDALSEAVERGTALVRQLLAFARREPLQAEVFDAAQCALRLVDGLRSVVGPGIKVVADLPERPCWVSTDVAQFESAIINLAVNARDAMNGEGTLIIRVAAGPAPPNSIQGTAVAVSVSDTGIGIPPDKLQQVFEPFFTTKGPGKGTGLGLSQVYGYIKESGGDVRVASAPGEGAVFTLYLPQIEAPEKQDPVRESIDR